MIDVFGANFRKNMQQLSSIEHQASRIESPPIFLTGFDVFNKIADYVKEFKILYIKYYRAN